MEILIYKAMIVIERFVSIKKIDDRYNSCSGLFGYHYSPTKKKIESAYVEWRDDIDFYKGRKPTADEYEQQINAIKEILRFLDEDMNPDRFVKDGSVDTAFCDIYLKRMKPRLLPEDIKDLKSLFFALQWLLQQKTEDCQDLHAAEEEAEDTIHVEATEEEDEELSEILNKLNIGVDSRSIMLDKVKCPDRFLYIAILYMYQDEKKPWAYNANVLSNKIVGILPETKDLSLEEQEKKAETIYRRVSRALKEEMGYLSPKDLTIENVRKKTGHDNEKVSKTIEIFEKANIAVRGCREAIRRKKQGDSIDDSEVTVDETK